MGRHQKNCLLYFKWSRYNVSLGLVTEEAKLFGFFLNRRRFLDKVSTPTNSGKIKTEIADRRDDAFAIGCQQVLGKMQFSSLCLYYNLQRGNKSLGRFNLLVHNLTKTFS